MKLIAVDKLIKVLQLYQKYAELHDREYAVTAYKRVIANIQRKNVSKMSLDDIKNTAGVGVGIYDKITRYDPALNDPDFKAYLRLREYKGIGSQHAREYVKQGIRNLTDLQKAHKRGDIKLTKMQLLGIKYHKDLAKVIPRAEVSTISRQIIDAIPVDGLVAETLGSYRRGKQVSGDIDILISHKSAAIYKQLPDIVLNAITHHANYIDTIARGNQKFSFLWRGKSCARQIDIFIAPMESYFAFLLYATGSATHNEYIRGLCKQRGYRLNQTGLYKSGKLIPLDSERDLYRILGIAYVEPKDR